MKTLHLHLVTVAVAAAALAASPSAADAQKKQRDRITREEIAALPQKDMDLFQVIRNLRPHFLEPPRGVRTMGNSGTFPTVVYVDGKKETGMDALRLMNPMDIDDIRYMEPSQSMNEFGQTANGGAIVIKRYKGAKTVVPAGAPDTSKRPPTR